MKNEKSKIDFSEFIENNTLRLEASSRGGGIEIDVSKYFGEGAKMTAYQNYLGGGMLGSIGNSHNFETDKRDLLEKFDEELARYFHNITNHEDDEWESATFEQGQARARSAY